MAALGHVYAVAGRKGEARKILAELEELAKHRYVSPYDRATVYAGLGEKDQAITWLERAYQERSDGLVFLKVEPKFDGLRSDPRFVDLLRHVGFPGSESTL
jgi:hypothetical protein